MLSQNRNNLPLLGTQQRGQISRPHSAEIREREFLAGERRISMGSALARSGCTLGWNTVRNRAGLIVSGMLNNLKIELSSDI